MDLLTSLASELHQIIKSYLPLRSLYFLCLSSKSLRVYGFKTESDALTHLHQNLVNELKRELNPELIEMIIELDMIVSGSFILSVALSESYDNADIDIYMEHHWRSIEVEKYQGLFEKSVALTEATSDAYVYPENFNAKHIGKSFSGKYIQLVYCETPRFECIEGSDTSFCKNYFNMTEIKVSNLDHLLNKEGTLTASKNVKSFKKRYEKYSQRGFVFTNISSISNKHELKQLIEKFGLEIITYKYDQLQHDFSAKHNPPQSSYIMSINLSHGILGGGRGRCTGRRQKKIPMIHINNINPGYYDQIIAKNMHTTSIFKMDEFQNKVLNKDVFLNELVNLSDKFYLKYFMHFYPELYGKVDPFIQSDENFYSKQLCTQQSTTLMQIYEPVIKSTNLESKVGFFYSFDRCIDSECVVKCMGCNIEHFHLKSDSRCVLINDDNIPDNLREHLHIIDINNEEDIMREFGDYF